MNINFVKDYEKFGGNEYKYSFLKALSRSLKNHELSYIWWGRALAATKNSLMRKIYKIVLHHYRKRYGLEINFKNVCVGIRLIHPWNITVNDNAVLGDNVTLFKGCTIGVIESGSKTGNLTIGNNVTVFANATICGNIHIGDNTTIAAGAFVNFDVPEDSTVIGNPGIIHYRK